MTRKTDERRFWLFKSEPGSYSIDDLERDGTTFWDGIRNYQARNFLRDEVSVGDGVLFYHSNAKPPGVAGLARVTREAHPDPSQHDPKSPYYDPKSKPEDATWLMVDVGFVTRFGEVVSLEQLKADPHLEGMLVIKKGQRLSIQPVEPRHWQRVLALAGWPE